MNAESPRDLILMNGEYFKGMVEAFDQIEAARKLDDPKDGLTATEQKLRDKYREGLQVVAVYNSFQMPESVALKRVEQVFNEAQKISVEGAGI